MRTALSLLACLLAGCAPLKEFHNPPTMFAAGGYTNAVAVTGGKTVYVAGQVAFDAKGGIVGRGDLRAQFRQVYENVRLALAAAGATPDDVVKLNTYVVNWNPATDRAIQRDARASFFTGPNPPASTTVGVQGLAIEGLLVEIEVIAVVKP
jgi:enamine deaminase RidA (YjgF/YER057c/UK114 family)